MNLEEYILLFQQEFSYLFDDYGFQIVHKEEYRAGYGWFRIGFQTNVNRILFVRERGGGVQLLGPLTAPFEDETNRQWINMMSLLVYVMGTEWDWGFLSKLPYLEQPRASLSFNAKKLQPQCSEIFRMFESQDTVRKWKPSYEKYLEEKFQRLYGSKGSDKNWSRLVNEKSLKACWNQKELGF